MGNIMANTNIAKRYKKLKVVWGVIEKYRSIQSLNTDVELAKRIGKSSKTISNRKESPGQMTLEELLMYADTLNIPPYELAEAITGKRIIQMEGEKLG